MESYYPHREIVHLHVFIDVAPETSATPSLPREDPLCGKWRSMPLMIFHMEMSPDASRCLLSRLGLH